MSKKKKKKKKGYEKSMSNFVKHYQTLSDCHILQSLINFLSKLFFLLNFIAQKLFIQY